MIRGILYIVVFATGFFTGGLFPSFSAQYHQRLQGQYDQVTIDLAPFQKIANSYHGGSLDALVQHHLSSTDPTFYAEGEAIQMMIDSRMRLAESKATVDAPYIDQVWYFYRRVDEDVARATWDSFKPALITTENAVTFSLTIATLAIVILWAVWSAVGLIIRTTRTASRT